MVEATSDGRERIKRKEKKILHRLGFSRPIFKFLGGTERRSALEAAKKAESQTVDLASILRPKDRECDGSKKLTRKKVQQLAKNAFGNYQNRLPDDIKNGNTKPDEALPYPPNNVPDNLTLLQLLALNALDLTAPASNILLQNRLNKWVQLSGHEGSFAPAGPGTIWKKSMADRIEIQAYEKLMADTLASMVPTFYKDVEYNDERFIEMQDLLYNFKDPAIMDIKIGTRTFLESEVQNSKPRTDLYEKMIGVNPDAPTSSEKVSKAITKLRYMQFREQQSSSAELGFRIEGFKVNGKEPIKDLKQLKSKEDICRTIRQFINNNEKIRLQLIARLQNLRTKLEKSTFFQTHEVLGSSLLIIHDEKRAGAWMIDFAKTLPLPEGIKINHKSKWEFGNHEDGYLLGLENVVSVLKDCSKSKNKNREP